MGAINFHGKVESILWTKKGQNISVKKKKNMKRRKEQEVKDKILNWPLRWLADLVP